MSFPGFATPSALIAGVNNLVKIFQASPTRNIGGIVMDITVEEDGADELVITDHPVEYGADISDHAYKLPARLVIRAMSSNSSLSAGADPNYVVDIYNQLLALQSSGEVFTIQTGKRFYLNMLMKSLQQTTDEKTEAALDVRMEFQQIIIAQTAPTAVPPASQQKMPAQTAGTQNLGTKQLLPAAPITPPVN